MEGQAERWVESRLEGKRGNKAKIADAMLYAWSEHMFAGGTEASVVLGGSAVIDELMVGDCVLMKLALQRLYWFIVTLCVRAVEKHCFFAHPQCPVKGDPS